MNCSAMTTTACRCSSRILGKTATRAVVAARGRIVIRNDVMLPSSNTNHATTQIRSLTLPSQALLQHYQVAGGIVDDVAGLKNAVNSDHDQYHHDIDDYRPRIARDQSPGPSVRRRTYGTATTTAGQVSSFSSTAAASVYTTMDSSDDYDGDVEYTSGGATTYVDSTLNDGYYQEDYDEWSLHCAPANQTNYDLGQYDGLEMIEPDAVYSVGETRDVVFGQATRLSSMMANDLYEDYNNNDIANVDDGEDVSLDY